MKTKTENQKLPSPIKQKIITALKLTFVVGLLYFLVEKGFISVAATQGALQNWKKSLPAIGVLFFTALLGVVRWQWLLQAQGIHLKWSRTFQLTLIGNFFNIAIPGSVSGDFVKAFYVGKEIHGHRTRAFGSILFDRVAGVSSLVLVSASALLIGWSSFADSPMLKAIHFLVVTAATVVLTFYGYLFLVKETHDPLLVAFRWLEKKIKKAKAITEIYESLRRYHECRLAVTRVVILSVFIHLGLGWSCLSFAQALGENQISFLPLLVIVPLGTLVTAIPVAPAGVGTGNIAFLYFFHLIGSERGADIFSLVALTNILVGAFGGIVYFRFRSHGQLPNAPNHAIDLTSLPKQST